MPLSKYLDTYPVVGADIYIHPSAQVIGDVTIGDDCSLWPNAVIRGDVNSIRIGRGTNVQDLVMCHVTHKSAHLPNGYTLTIGTTSTHAVAPGVYTKLAYDPIKSFAPVSLVAITPYLLVVNPKVEAQNLKEFVALAKREPGKMNFASAGNGSTTHLSMEMLKGAAGIDLQHVPYKGNAQADLAVIGNEVQALFGSMPALLQNAKAGKVRALAVGTAQRSPALPEVPTVAELGYPGFEATLWLGVFAPAGTPKPIVDRLNKTLLEIVATDDFKALMERNGADPISNSPEQFASMLRAELERYGKVVKTLGLRLD